MGLGTPRLKIKTQLESNPLKSRILVRRLAVHYDLLAVVVVVVVVVLVVVVVVVVGIVGSR